MTHHRPNRLPCRNRAHHWKRGIGIALTFVVTGLGGYLAFRYTDTSMAYDLVRPRNLRQETGSAKPVPDDVDHVLRIPVGPPDATLDVWVLDAEGPPQRDPVASLVILHGIADSKRTQISVARRAARAGVTAVLVDVRGHGQSSSTELTYGVREKQDLTQVLDYLEGRSMAHGPWGAYGPSYGGAIALQFAGHDSRVHRVLSVGAFATMSEEVEAYHQHAARNAWWIPNFWYDRFTKRAGRMAGFNPDDASPLFAVAHTQAEITIVHGEQDEVVPFAQAEELAAACAPKCRFIALPGRDHLGSLSNPTLREAIRSWFTPNAPPTH